MKMCRSCCSSGKYCLTSAKFYACTDVTGFTVKWYRGWTTGTTPTGTLEATDTVSSAVSSGSPYCFTPSDGTASYSALIQKSGWIDTIVRFTGAGSSTVNWTVGLAPSTLAVTHDHGSGTLTTTTTGPTVGTSGVATNPVYKGCFTFTANVSCTTATSCPGTSGTAGFTLQVQKGNATGGCNATSVISCLQVTAAGVCSTGGTPTAAYQPASCSGTTLASSCSGGVATNSLWSDQATSCGTPLSVAFHFTTGLTAPCDGSSNTLIATSSATVTY